MARPTAAQQSWFIAQAVAGGGRRVVQVQRVLKSSAAVLAMTAVVWLSRSRVGGRIAFTTVDAANVVFAHELVSLISVSHQARYREFACFPVLFAAHLMHCFTGPESEVKKRCSVELKLSLSEFTLAYRSVMTWLNHVVCVSGRCN